MPNQMHYFDEHSRQQDYFAERALLDSGWANKVLFSIKNGQFHSFKINSSPTPKTITLSGPVLPTLANLHSHAFQRVMAVHHSQAALYRYVKSRLHSGRRIPLFTS